MFENPDTQGEFLLKNFFSRIDEIKGAWLGGRNCSRGAEHGGKSAAPSRKIILLMAAAALECEAFSGDVFTRVENELWPRADLPRRWQGWTTAPGLFCSQRIIAPPPVCLLHQTYRCLLAVGVDQGFSIPAQIPPTQQIEPDFAPEGASIGETARAAVFGAQP